MTEQEWLACTDPVKMLGHLGDGVSERKLWLYAVACCRRIPGYLESEPDRQGLELAERHADGLAADEDFAALPDDVRDIRWYRRDCRNAIARAMSCYWSYVWGSHELYATTKEAQDQVRRQSDADLAVLLFDLFGNPFRLLTLPPAWQTPAAVALAQAAYEQRELPAGTLDTIRLAVLADALEEVGCDQVELLAHLRGPGPHVRGCWAVDLLLGRQ